MSERRIAVSGATGFVGRNLVRALATDSDVVALSRRSVLPREESPRVEWRSCDLFSLKQTEAALQGCTIAVYLVHSMLPQARMTQGSFQDIDLWLADNFSRACQTAGVERIIYLGGIMPPDGASEHLASRAEVESALGAYGAEVIALRAGMVIGPGGSSFVMMRRLVETLPYMICPAWTRTRSAPVFLGDVVELIRNLCLDTEPLEGVYDLAGPDQVSYLEMMRATADVLGKRRRFIKFPYVTPALSALWVRLITGFPRQLVNPLIKSLVCDMLPRGANLFERYGIKPLTMQESLRCSMAAEVREQPANGRVARPEGSAVNSRVYSIQRISWGGTVLPRMVVGHYFRWLNRVSGGLLRCDVDEMGNPSIRLLNSESFLSFHRLSSRCSDNREILEIAGGILTVPSHGQVPRFECRLAGRPGVMLIGILEYAPRLPWWLYVTTQAILHAAVMKLFSSRLGRIGPVKPRCVGKDPVQRSCHTGAPARCSDIDRAE